jgi:hypothetical protein
MSGPPQDAAARAGAREPHISRAPRCLHTRLTKPECHCRSCLSEQIAAYGPRAPRAPQR